MNVNYYEIVRAVGRKGGFMSLADCEQNTLLAGFVRYREGDAVDAYHNALAEHDNNEKIIAILLGAIGDPDAEARAAIKIGAIIVGETKAYIAAAVSDMLDEEAAA